MVDRRECISADGRIIPAKAHEWILSDEETESFIEPVSEVPQTVLQKTLDAVAAEADTEILQSLDPSSRAYAEVAAQVLPRMARVAGVDNGGREALHVVAQARPLARKLVGTVPALVLVFGGYFLYRYLVRGPDGKSAITANAVSGSPKALVPAPGEETKQAMYARNPESPTGILEYGTKALVRSSSAEAASAGNSQEEQLTPSAEIQQPKRLRGLEPVYPKTARAAGVEGDVILQVTVNVMGDVEEVKVLHGHPLLNEAAIEAVKHWKYAPAVKDGQPVMAFLTVKANFRL